MRIITLKEIAEGEMFVRFTNKKKYTVIKIIGNGLVEVTDQDNDNDLFSEEMLVHRL